MHTLRGAFLAILVTTACTGQSTAPAVPPRPAEARPVVEAQPAVDAGSAVGAQPVIEAGPAEPRPDCESDADCVLAPGPPSGCDYPCGGCRSAVPRGQKQPDYGSGNSFEEMQRLCPEKLHVTCSPCPGPRADPEPACVAGRCELR